MSATDELRRMLDERGVEWGNIRNDGSESDYLTEWQFEDNQGKAIAIEWAVGSGLSVETHRYHLTPAQAVEATLGRGECKVEERRDGWGVITRHCGNCGADLDCDTRNRQNYCPSCGFRLVKR